MDYLVNGGSFNTSENLRWFIVLVFHVLLTSVKKKKKSKTAKLQSSDIVPDKQLFLLR